MQRVVGLVVALLCVLAASACGADGSNDVLRHTAANLGSVRSGKLKIQLLVEPTGLNRAKPFGFRLEGPFSLGKGDAEPPVLRLRLSRIENGRELTTTIVSTGEEAYVESKAGRTPLSAEQQANLVQAAKQLRGASVLARFPIEDWIEDPELSDGGVVGGADTDRVSGELNVARVATDLRALVTILPGGADLGGGSFRQVERAVRSSHFELYSGKDDHLLRKLELRADLGPDVPPTLGDALASLAGARATFLVAIDRPNTRQVIRG